MEVNWLAGVYEFEGFQRLEAGENQEKFMVEKRELRGGREKRW